MPTFRITGRGRKTNRKRSGVYLAIDQATAVSMAEAADTLVTDVVRLPDPVASPDQLEYARFLGLTPARDVARSDLMADLLEHLGRRRRLAEIAHLTTADGERRVARVEPYAFQRSREGLRLRCFLPPSDSEPDVVYDYQTAGWHLYLIDDIEDVRDGGATFIRRLYQRHEDTAIFSMDVILPESES